MNSLFEELDHQTTPMGEISLRRRRELTLGIDVYEAKLDDEFLMSSLFTVAEVALAELGLGRVEGERLDVVVGGLGLGYTAEAVIEDHRVRTLRRHRSAHPGHRLARPRPAPALRRADRGSRAATSTTATSSPLVASDEGFGPEVPEPVDAILVDIDHSPGWVLHPSHAAFYEPDGLRRLRRLLRPGGVFGLWSDEPPDPAFTARARTGLLLSERPRRRLREPYAREESTNTVYIGESVRG